MVILNLNLVSFFKVNRNCWFFDMVKHELRVTSYELRVKSLKARVESLKARVEIEKFKSKSSSYEFKSTRYELKSTRYELKSTSYKFKSTSYEFKSTGLEFKSTSSSSNPRIIKSMKTQVNSLKSSSFLKIVSPELFVNLWGNSYVLFLVIISCFTFPTLHDYGFSKKLSE